MANLRVTGIHFVLEIPIYTQDALFVLGYNRIRASEIFRKYGADDETIEYVRTLKACKGVTSQDQDTGKFFIYMEDLPRRSSEHGSLVHELFHLVEQIMDRVGMKHEIQVSSEAYAYLLGQLTADALGRIWTATNV